MEPTHYHYITGNPDVLDIALVKNTTMQIDLDVVDELSSDHNPVLLQIGRRGAPPQSDTRSRTDWQQFKSHLETNFGSIPIITSTQELDDAVLDFERRVARSIKASTRALRAKSNKTRLPQHLKDLIRERNRARRRAHRTFHPADKQDLNRLTNEVRYALNDFRNERWKRRLETLSTEDNSVWKMTKALRNERNPLPPIHSERGLVFSDDDKAEAFADSLELQCRPNWREVDVIHVERIERTVRRKLRAQPDTHLRPVTPEEVVRLIAGLRKRKAPGPDEITNIALRNLPKRAIMALVGIFNAMLRLQYFPVRWKCAIVIFIPKPGKDRKFPQNHRPISLLSSVGKLAERVILSRLKEVVDEKHIIPDEQFGFRERHSTSDQLLRVTEFIGTGLNWKQHTGALFLDVSKAFDTVWHEGLIYKLFVQNVPLALVKILKSFLTERNFRARIGTSLSSERFLEAGVPQGSVLSPTLYAIFTADLPKPAGCDLAVYADDTAVLSRSRCAKIVTRRLQGAADELGEWLRLWRIEVNPEKSSAILFTRRRTIPHGQITMFGQAIPWTDVVKYLGIKFDKKLYFSEHVKHAIVKTNMVRSQLYPLICRRSRMSIKNKLLLYKTVIRPAMTYGSLAWGHVAKTQMYKLQVLQNKFLRAAFDAPWFMRNNQLHREADLPTIQEYIKARAVKGFALAAEHPNQLVRSAVDYDEEGPSRVKRPKTVLLN